MVDLRRGTLDLTCLVAPRQESFNPRVWTRRATGIAPIGLIDHPDFHRDFSVSESAVLPSTLFDWQNELQRSAAVGILRRPNPPTVILDD
jgi:hypothetical protein